jgi:hypothetical protein
MPNDEHERAAMVTGLKALALWPLSPVMAAPPIEPTQTGDSGSRASKVGIQGKSGRGSGAVSRSEFSPKAAV